MLWFQTKNEGSPEPHESSLAKKARACRASASAAVVGSPMTSVIALCFEPEGIG
jgi:hypothetical protein